MDWEVEPFDDPGECVYRAVHPDHANEDGTVDVAAFDNVGDSMNRARYRVPRDTLVGRFKEWRVGGSTAGELREAKFKTGDEKIMVLEPLHAPSKNNRSHSRIEAQKDGVFMGKLSNDLAKRGFRSVAAGAFRVLVLDDEPEEDAPGGVQ